MHIKYTRPKELQINVRDNADLSSAGRVNQGSGVQNGSHTRMSDHRYRARQSQKAVSAYFTSEQILYLVSAEQCSVVLVYIRLPSSANQENTKR